MKKIAVLQSNYLSWRGYFDLINSVDEFIVYDHVQYTKNDWRNRNLIISKTGTQWITIPVSVKGHLTNSQSIDQTRVADMRWSKKHIGSLRATYSKAPYFKTIFPFIEEVFQKVSKLEYLSDISVEFIKAISTWMGITTKITRDKEYKISGDRNTKLLSIIKQASGTNYISGIAAKQYLNEKLFNSEGVEVSWTTPDIYPDYPQLFGYSFDKLSIIDLLFMTGDNFSKFMLSFNK